MSGDLQKKLNIGLTEAEVSEKTAAGLVNKDLNIKTKSYAQIFKDNTFSLFNLINTILLVCIIISGSIKNALFFGVVIWNFALGSIQEIRAKRTIDKLSLLTAPKAFALRDGKIKEIPAKDIVLGEIMQLKSGNQVCADCVCLEGTCQVNESLVTGESDPILKTAGDHLLSGSYIVSGTIKAEAEHIGEDNYVSKITLGAKYVKKNNSVILGSVKNVVKIVAIALIPLAIAMVFKNFFVIDQGFSEAMVTTVAAVSAMIPGGLILLVSTVMAVSVVRLSMHRTLAQDLYCVENLARVDVLCLDKTGTITEGSMRVEEICPAGQEQDVSAQLLDRIKEFAISMSDENSTIEAIRTYFDIKPQERKNAPRQIPFSSDRKWSLLETDDGSLILGAPEFICKDMDAELKNQIGSIEIRGKRVVAFALSKGRPEGRNLPEDLKIKALIIIGDKVRENAGKTLDYFEEQGVTLKVLSGDNPVTVSMIAGGAGLDGAEKYIDMTGITAYEEIEEIVENYTIFGRVTPYQKLDIIKALKAHGHIPAMIGDGANDVLALKEADCSIAMQSGADAARNVASMVLLDSDFASLPLVVAEGRKSINNLQRSAGLYLTKTTYAFILTIIFLFLAFAYPFQNIQITLIGVVTIGMPSFFLALEPNKNRIRENFLKNVFSMAIPSGILSAAAIMASVLTAREAVGAGPEQVQTIATFTTILVGYLVILNIAGKMNKWKWIMMAWIVFVAVGCVLIFPKLFGIAQLSLQMWLIVLGSAAVFYILHAAAMKHLVPKLETADKTQKKQ